MAVINVIFAGLIAHFSFDGGNTAAVVKDAGHSAIIAVTDATGNMSFLKNCKATGTTHVTKICTLDGQYLRIVLPPGKPKHDGTFDKGVPHLPDVTGGAMPMNEVVSRSPNVHLAALVDYSGTAGTLSVDCYFKEKQQLVLGGHTSNPFCAAKYTRFQIAVSDATVTIENMRNRTQTFTVPADSTIFIYNTSQMAGGFSEYRWMIDDDKGLAGFHATGQTCAPFVCDLPQIPGSGTIHPESVSIECVNTQWP